MKYHAKVFTDRLSPFIYEQKPSYTGDSSPAQSEKNLQQNFKQVLEDKIYELEKKLRESHSNMLGMEEEIKTLKSELLQWVNRWHDFKLKEYKYKAIKKSMAFANEILLKKGEQHKIKMIKLQSRLVEARRGEKLQSMTLNRFLVLVYL